LLLRDTDRTLARLIGALLTEARASSALFADAHPVAVAVEAGGGVVQTADPDDLGRLAAPYRTVVIEPLAQRKG
jgi:predicted nucleic acid-binding protein